MGPSATVDFYDKLVRHTPATRDQDHLRVVIWADPTIPSRQEAILAGGTDPTPWLENGVRQLIAAGAEIIVSPCNTVHAYLAPLMVERPVEFIDIIDTTVQVVRRKNAGRVGLLATDAALASELYQRALDAAAVDWLLPDSPDQQRLMSVIEGVKAGRPHPELRAQFAGVLRHLNEKGVATAIAGCTEISTLLQGEPLDDTMPIVDPAVELARATIARAAGPARA
jgi:aspartate racemase